MWRSSAGRGLLGRRPSSTVTSAVLRTSPANAELTLSKVTAPAPPRRNGSAPPPMPSRSPSPWRRLCWNRRGWPMIAIELRPRAEWVENVGYRYDVLLDGEIIVHGSRDPEYDA